VRILERENKTAHNLVFLEMVAQVQWDRRENPENVPVFVQDDGHCNRVAVLEVSPLESISAVTLEKQQSLSTELSQD
jgi:hypothetical protein